MNRLIPCVLLLLHFHAAWATHVSISNATYQDINFGKPNAAIVATLTIQWQNAWRNDKNHDAVWIFFKIKNEHEVRSERHGVLKRRAFKFIHNYSKGSAEPDFWMPEDAAGIFVFPKTAHRGDVCWRIQVEIDLPKVRDLGPEGLKFVQAHAIEMVYVPQGAFHAGDSDTSAQRNTAAFFDFATKGHYKINSEAAIAVGAGNGNLFYHHNNEQAYKGDAAGPIPAAFPKGFNAFYCMKYELDEGQYTAFLNSISYYYTTNRANFGGRFYQKQRGGIYLEDEIYRTSAPNRPASFLSFEDQAAFADWAALRPMTELEFEKAARGPALPLPNDFPWGAASRDKLSRFYNENGDLVLQAPLDEKDLNDANLALFGASHYWVMDLNKSLWERCVSVGNENGRNFKGTHGDGDLGGYYGTATNEDWPKGMSDNSGIGYRGGGTYIANMVGSPEGRVGHRDFAAWGDGPRDIAYGFRAVRTAE
jgi:formylglycine-generating enzyme required for sulfatase activity